MMIDGNWNEYIMACLEKIRLSSFIYSLTYTSKRPCNFFVHKFNPINLKMLDSPKTFQSIFKGFNFMITYFFFLMMIPSDKYCRKYFKKHLYIWNKVLFFSLYRLI